MIARDGRQLSDGKRRILVIDDEKDLIELVRYNHEKEGFSVRGAQDGESGLSAAIKYLPDLIVVDLMLPGVDGLDVCKSLRLDKRTARVPIIMLTAKSAESDRILGLELGADDYITKPFSPRELVARIKAVLRRTSSRRRLRSNPARQFDHRSRQTGNQLSRRSDCPDRHRIPVAGSSLPLALAVSFPARAD